MSPAQCQQLERIVPSLRKMGRLAIEGCDFIAVGEALNAITALIDGSEVDVDVRITVGFRRGDSEAQEGAFVDVYITDTDLVLSETRTFYTRAVGSDHESEEYARLSEGNGAQAEGVSVWLRRVEEIVNEDETELSVERNHA